MSFPSTATIHSACSLPSVSRQHQKAKLSKKTVCFQFQEIFLQAGAHSEVAAAASMVLRATAWADYITS